MSNGSATVLRRVLGRRLRQMRIESGLTLKDAAKALEVSHSKLARIENARQGTDVHFVRSALDVYGAGDEWASTLQLTRETRIKPWWQAYRIGDSTYVAFEAEAVYVQEYTGGFVPGLLQTADYARAVFDASLVQRNLDQVLAEVEVRMLRQRRLRDDDEPLTFVAIIDESVLHNPVGGPNVLRGQLTHLIEAVQLPTVTLGVLPARSGALALTGSCFSVLSFGDLGEPDLAYVEHALGAAHVEGEQEVRMARKKFDQLCTLALDPAASLALLREVAAAI